MKATLFAASCNRDQEWKQCCANAMGFEWVDQFDTDGNNNNNNADVDDDIITLSNSVNYSPIQQIINLLDDEIKVDNNNDNVDDDDEFVEDCYYSSDNNINNNNINHHHRHHGQGRNKGYVDNDYDQWMGSAIRIQTDLDRMVQFIRSKQSDYVGLNTMADEEASLIQSTVTSFTATTATDLETLREMIVPSSTGTGGTTRRYQHSSTNNNNLANHRSGIVQILLGQLQEEVAIPFGIMQKQRTRMAVQLWQNPLQCKLYQQPVKRKVRDKQQQQQGGNKDLSFDDLLSMDDDDNEQHDQRYLPRRQPQRGEGGYNDFITKYAHKSQSTIPPSTPPNFVTQLMMMNKRQRRSNTVDVGPQLSTTTTTIDSHKQPQKARIDIPRHHQLQSNNSNVPPTIVHNDQDHIHQDDDDNNNYHEQLQDDLNDEAIQLTTALIATSDLDSVQQMEARMVQITALIGQFSNLVQEQQEQVLQVHESAKTTKDNMNKGQENLIDAADRTKRSKNYKAWIIVIMALIMLFFHTVMN